MYAIIEIGGQQFKVAEKDVVYVNRLPQEPEKKFSIDQVLLISDEKGKVTVGKPVVKNSKVDATVLEHAKADKLIVFKKKHRKGYQKRTGHRQQLTRIRIDKISVK